MVCIPCILAPIALWVWFHFLQPIVSKFLNLRKPAPIDTVSSFGTSSNADITEKLEENDLKLNSRLQETQEIGENKYEKVIATDAAVASESGDKKNV